MTQPKRIDVAEFRRLGYLQELNRGFLHPHGLALEVIVEDDGTERLGGVWDYRDDPEGIAYGADITTDPKFRSSARSVAEIRERRRPIRVAALGYWIQPVEGDGE